MSQTIRVGTSGWSYDHWVGRFYPDGLPSTKRLDFYSKEFDTVEVNSSFYHLPRETTFEKWRDGTPGDFLFAVKGSRYVTHVKKLVGVREPVTNLVGRVKNLQLKLGPILWQLPPQLRRDDGRLEDFLKILPKDLAHVIEFRDISWFCDEVYDLMDRYGVSFCSVSSPKITDLVVTAGMGYLRMHGEKGWYSSNYTLAKLKSWAHRITKSFDGCSQSFVYFNNDANAYAVGNARDLRNLLDGS